MTRRFLSITSALVLLGTGSFVALTGCGGGNGTSDIGSRPNSVYVTRASEGSYLSDALVLASREAPDGFIPTTTANAIQDDLVRIRVRYPDVAEMRSETPLRLRFIDVSTNPSGTVAAAWAQGKILTGNTAVDTVLARYKGESVKALFGQKTQFELRFTDPVNTSKVMYELTLAANQDTLNVYPEVPPSPSLTFEEASQISGVSRTAIARKTTDSGRVYVFVRGYGDCAAGCIHAHTRTVTVGNDGTLSMQETNPPPDGNYNH